MRHFDAIKSTLYHIDENLDAPINSQSLAARCHFSPFYFHRLFCLMIGKPIGAYIRDRRLEKACQLLSRNGETITSICMRVGFSSSSAFSRAFRRAYGCSPRKYREEGLVVQPVSVEELVLQFTNRIQGGIVLKPSIIQRGLLRIAGVSGEGGNTAEVWQRFEALSSDRPLENQLNESGYEIRVLEGDSCRVQVGHAVSKGPLPKGYELFLLPAAHYASFDVYVEQGYMSENEAMNQWLSTNEEGYVQKFLGTSAYVVEYYDERFHGEEAGSIVEIWLPIQK